MVVGMLVMMPVIVVVMIVITTAFVAGFGGAFPRIGKFLLNGF